ncbi:MAG: Hsp20/alpha crystallin family protein [Planctomycetota bacterium]|nr:Hsp20/alpha crystallin family protein [Planctomycetota bacterium]
MLTRARRMTADPLAALTGEMDRLFESMFSWPPRLQVTEKQPRWFSAPLNMWEDDNHVYAETELPGVKMDDLEILVTGDELRIKGTREIDLPENARVLRCERGSGSFERMTNLPSEIDVDKVEASLRNGVLTITLPKTEARRPRKVAVKAQAGGN